MTSAARDFWYKALAANDTKLNVHVIPMNGQPREGTGSPRATFTVPDGHVGDGRWHHGRLKYDFTENAEVKSVHFAVRIDGSQGDLLLDDVSYLDRTFSSRGQDFGPEAGGIRRKRRILKFAILATFRWPGPGG